MTQPPTTVDGNSTGGNTPDASTAAHVAPGALNARHTVPDGSTNKNNAGVTNSRRIARVAVTGWALYAVSWVTPSSDGKQFGATAFVQSVRLAWHLLTMGSVLLGLCVTLGWLANFTIVPRRLPISLRIVATLAPWLAFAVVLAKVPARATYFLYFYPWALGIALIHAARCSSMKAAS